MAYVLFVIVVTAVYAVATAALIREMQAVGRERWRETQSVPLLLASAFAYAVFIGKTHQLMQLFGVI